MRNVEHQLAHNLDEAEAYAAAETGNCQNGSNAYFSWAACTDQATVDPSSCRSISDVTTRCDVIELRSFAAGNRTDPTRWTRWRAVVPVFTDFQADGTYRDHFRDGDKTESSEKLCSDTGENGAPPTTPCT